MIRRLLLRLGFKPYLRCCPRGEHWWRQVYGDERMQAGTRYVCENCPQRADELAEDALVVENEADRMVRELRRRLD